MNNKKRIILLIFFFIVFSLSFLLIVDIEPVFAAGAPVYDMVHFRWRNDDGSEATATYGELEDTASSTVGLGTPIRIRFSVDNTGNAIARNKKYHLYWGTNSDCTTNTGWSIVPAALDCTTEAACTFDTQLVDGGDITSADLTPATGTFVDGQQTDSVDSISANVSIDDSPDEFSEIEFGFQVTTNAAGSTTYYFKPTVAGALFNDYSSLCASLTTEAAAAGTLDVTASSTQSFDSSIEFAFTSQTSTMTNAGAITMSDDRGGSPGWTVNLQASDWKSGEDVMQLDYAGTGSDDNLGKMCAFPSDANLYAESGSLTGVTKQANDCFSASVSIIDLVVATSGNGIGTYWMTDMKLEQFIPGNPTSQEYTTTIFYTAQ